MKEYDIFVPLYYNSGTPIEPAKFQHWKARSHRRHSVPGGGDVNRVRRLFSIEQRALYGCIWSLCSVVLFR